MSLLPKLSEDTHTNNNLVSAERYLNMPVDTNNTLLLHVSLSIAYHFILLYIYIRETHMSVSLLFVPCIHM
jgi:hypothetical protein